MRASIAAGLISEVRAHCVLTPKSLAACSNPILIPLRPANKSINVLFFFHFFHLLFRFIQIFQSHCSTCDISINCGALGCVVLVHHRLIVIFDTPSCSAKYVFVIIFSAKTTLILFLYTFFSIEKNISTFMCKNKQFCLIHQVIYTGMGL